ncbi:hypothetical protein HRW07_07190 [Streptomyces lunaelactis]|nr:hypothetical protein [Streptomyces lunaelactis]NUL03025.1 hypothetical protein [Streptomyces lunaelactis]
MDAADVGHGHSEHTEGVRVAQIGLGGEGEPGQILQRATVLGRHPGLFELHAVQLDVVVRVPQCRAQAAELEGSELLARHLLGVVQQLRGQGFPTAGRGGL